MRGSICVCAAVVGAARLLLAVNPKGVVHHNRVLDKSVHDLEGGVANLGLSHSHGFGR